MTNVIVGSDNTLGFEFDRNLNPDNIKPIKRFLIEAGVPVKRIFNTSTGFIIETRYDHYADYKVRDGQVVYDNDPGETISPDTRMREFVEQKFGESLEPLTVL